MIVSDWSAALPKESKKLENEYVRLRRLFDQWDAAGRSDHDLNLLSYLMRRASRPIYNILKKEYVKIWGSNASFSYFFPRATTDMIWHRATDRLKKERNRATRKPRLASSSSDQRPEAA